MIRGRQSDKSEKDLTEQDMPNSHENKERLLKREQQLQEEKGAGGGGGGKGGSFRDRQVSKEKKVRHR